MSIFIRRIFVTLAALISAATFAHDGHLNDAPWRACDDQHVGAACAYENAAKDVYRGTCRSMSDELMCVRNQPIEKFNSTVDPEPADQRRLLLQKSG